MSDGILHSALREWRVHMTRRSTLVVLAGVGVVLGIAGPFDSDVLKLAPRIGYWVFVAALTYSIGHLTSELIDHALGDRLSRVWHIVLVGVLSGIAIGITLGAVNAAFFGIVPGVPQLPALFASTIGIALIVSAVLHYAAPGRSEEPEEGAAAAIMQTQPSPSILDRLPLEKRGALISLSVDDHYVHVRTRKGSEMLLMRLSDAMREVGAIRGMQVHRSHWVALNEVAGARRKGDGASLTMSDGNEVPASRRYVADLREAGILPR